ncbi:MAG: hypothetical protein ABIJ65_11945 [Chloroflexota bacterium]
MSIQIPIWMEAETWAHLKALARADLRSPKDFLHLLVWREWATRRSMIDEPVTNQPRPAVTPSIPPTYHIHQGKQ